MQHNFPSQNTRTNLQGKSEAVFAVFYAAHEKEAEGFSCEDMALLHNFLKRAERALNFQVNLCGEAQISLSSSGDRCNKFWRNLNPKLPPFRKIKLRVWHIQFHCITIMINEICNYLCWK